MMSEILGQRVAPWANNLLGFSMYYIHAFGCTVTVLAECLGVTPDVVNDRLKAVNGFASDGTKKPDGSDNLDLVIWAKVEEAFPGIKINRVWSYNNDDVLAQLAAGNKVIVEVPAAPIGSPKGKHWVRYMGNHKLHDPWTVTERPTSDFPNPSGYAVISGAWVQPEATPVTPAPAATPETYQGIDLTNKESIKVAIDAWKDVANGLYVKADVYVADLNKISDALEVAHELPVDALVEHIKTLKENFKNQVLVATGLPAADQIEGQGAPITPAPVVTMVNLPPHEKSALITKLENTVNEIAKLLGL